jgi:hypothetical protein
MTLAAKDPVIANKKAAKVDMFYSRTEPITKKPADSHAKAIINGAMARAKSQYKL